MHCRYGSIGVSEEVSSGYGSTVAVRGGESNPVDKGTSWYVSIFLVVNAALGAGLLNFPHAFHAAGETCLACFAGLTRAYKRTHMPARAYNCADTHTHTQYHGRFSLTSDNYGLEDAMALGSSRGHDFEHNLFQWNWFLRLQLRKPRGNPFYVQKISLFSTSYYNEYCSEYISKSNQKCIRQNNFMLLPK